MSRHKIVTIVGTRPEVIKMAPVVLELLRRQSVFDHTLVNTSQHREMLVSAMSLFGMEPDIDLKLMEENQSLASFASRSLSSLTNLLVELKPDLILIQGDTTTVMTAALAAFYQDIRVGHVEAGLRSFNRRHPFPEEINRSFVGPSARGRISCETEWPRTASSLPATRLLTHCNRSLPQRRSTIKVSTALITIVCAYCL